jgi:hypothetical protein
MPAPNPHNLPDHATEAERRMRDLETGVGRLPAAADPNYIPAPEPGLARFLDQAVTPDLSPAQAAEMAQLEAMLTAASDLLTPAKARGGDLEIAESDPDGLTIEGNITDSSGTAHLVTITFKLHTAPTTA